MVQQDTELYVLPFDKSDLPSDKSERVCGFSLKEWKEILWIMFCPIM